MPAKKTELSFEENIKELENIVKKLETGDVTLDEMLSLFEEGVKRTKECTNQLKNAEQKITVLMKDQSGKINEVPFDEN